MAARERLTPYQSEDPSYTIPTHRMKEPGRQGIGPSLEISQSHTIEYKVSKIVPQRYSQKNKSPAVLGDSAARKRII